MGRHRHLTESSRKTASKQIFKESSPTSQKAFQTPQEQQQLSLDIVHHHFANLYWPFICFQRGGLLEDNTTCCTHPLCLQLRHIWPHVATCTDHENCGVANCALTKISIGHAYSRPQCCTDYMQQYYPHFRTCSEEITIYHELQAALVQADKCFLDGNSRCAIDSQCRVLKHLSEHSKKCTNTACTVPNCIYAKLSRDHFDKYQQVCCFKKINPDLILSCVQKAKNQEAKIQKAQTQADEEQIQKAETEAKTEPEVEEQYDESIPISGPYHNNPPPQFQGALATLQKSFRGSTNNIFINTNVPICECGKLYQEKETYQGLTFYNNNLKREISQLKENKERIEKALRDVDRELTDEKIVLSQLRTEQKELREEIEQLKTQKSKFEEQAVQIENEVKMLAKELEEQNKVKEETAKLQDGIEKLKEQTQKADDRCKEYLLKLSIAKKNFEDQQNQNTLRSHGKQPQANPPRNQVRWQPVQQREQVQNAPIMVPQQRVPIQQQFPIHYQQSMQPHGQQPVQNVNYYVYSQAPQQRIPGFD
ncbi:hypothetical protein L596_017767 [Steinernema carpocapsae]|uniref:Uncharacterized protein n=1 Tax=Steinernema carpocapsae TaxID=34508 RepID=A0A4U5N2L4_STECR|nr:hypothetical protein L596_017767 [Steinernema carpocapsae]